MGIQEKTAAMSELNTQFSTWMAYSQELIIILSSNYKEVAAQNQSIILACTITRVVNNRDEANKLMLVAQNIVHLPALEQDLSKTKELIYGANQKLIEFTEAVTGHEGAKTRLLNMQRIFTFLIF